MNNILKSFALFTVMLLVLQSLTFQPLYVQNSSNITNISNTTTMSSSTDQSNSVDLAAEMKRLQESNDPVDIATFAYVYGYPLINNFRSFDYATDPKHVSESESYGPWNQFHHRSTLADPTYKQVVTPNVDTLYSYVYYDVTKEPLVITIPDNINRYFTLEFVDAYTNAYHYLGTRTTGTNGGTYLFTGPGYTGKIPQNMTVIKSPTNYGLLFLRTVVLSPEDTKNATDIQKTIKVLPLSSYEKKTETATLEDVFTYYNESMSGLPTLIPTTGPRIFSELAYYLGKDMPPANESKILDKLASIGIVPDAKLTNQSSLPFNKTITAALEKGISNGEKLIDLQAQQLGKLVNGWNIITSGAGNFGTDYLGKAAFAKVGLWGNIPQEAVYPNAFIDGDGNKLNGKNNYAIHFDKGNLPPNKKGGFWSITVYDKDRLLYDNPINRYIINDRSQGLKYNDDGSLDIYFQHDKPSNPQQVPNWFPVPADTFSMTMRIYIPQESVLDGTYQPPPIQLVK